MKRRLSFFILIAVLVPLTVRAQVASTLGDDLGWAIGQAKTGVIKGAVNSWDFALGNSCGDIDAKTFSALRGHRSCPNLPDDVSNFVESSFFNSGAVIEINDDRCQRDRFNNYASSSPDSKKAIRSFTDDLQVKLPDLRQRYQELQELGRKMRNNPANVLIQRGDGPVSPINAQLYLDQTRKGWDELYNKTLDFNKLVFSSPLAHFPEGQKLLMKIVAEGGTPTEDAVRGAYAKAAADVEHDMNHLKSREVPGHPGSFNLSRTDKISLLHTGNPASWFKPGAQSADEAKKMMCNMDRVYDYGESVINGALTVATYGFGLEGYLVKVAFAAKLAGLAAKARGTTMTLETMNMLSWSFASASAINSAVDQCGRLRAHVGRSDLQCDIDPKDEVMTMARNNCALGIAEAAGTVAFTAGTTALGKRALAAAKAEMVERIPEEVAMPLRNMKARVVRGLSSGPTRPTRLTTVSLQRQYPQLARSIEDGAEALKSAPFEKWMELHGRMIKADIDAVKDPRIREALHASFKKMSSPEEWAAYATKLNLDAVQVMLDTKTPEALAALRAGKVERWAVTKVLIARAKARGESVQKALRGTDNETFFDTLEKGPFFDATFKKDSLAHGMDTHFVQRDFVADVVAKSMPDGSADLYRYLARDRTGQDLWRQIFDSLPDDARNGAPISPENLSPYLQKALPLQ